MQDLWLRMENKLPRKLSDLLELALNDLEKAENSKTHAVSMDVWYKPHKGGKCLVCLAGSVMAFSLGVKVDESISTTDSVGWCPLNFAKFSLSDKSFYTNQDADALSALNALRTGQVSSAAEMIDILLINGDVAYDREFDREIVDYHKDPDLFKTQLYELVNDLRTEGF